MPIKDHLIFKYKMAIYFARWLYIMFGLTIFGIISTVINELQSNTFTVFSIIGYGTGFLLAYFLFLKGGKALSRNCNQQIDAIMDGEIIRVEVLNITESKYVKTKTSRQTISVHSAGPARNTHNTFDITIYTCRDAFGDVFDVRRYYHNHTDISIGQNISVFIWEDTYHKHYEWIEQ